MRKKILIGVAVGAVAVTLLAATIIYRGGVFDQATQEVYVKKYSVSEVAGYMHEMANVLIVPEDAKIWGKESMDKENIAEVLHIAQNIEENSETSAKKDELIKIINDWSAGDFSHIVDDHNVVWEILHGTVGKAAGINEVEVTKALKNLK